MKLEDFRKEIDQVDAELVELFQKRLSMMMTLAEYKKENKVPIFDEVREKEVYEMHTEHLSDPVAKKYVRAFLENLVQMSRDYQKQLLNHYIYLIGMPGAGKTTVGRELAKAMGIQFYDLDQLIQEKTAKTIQSIIIYDGEDAYRELEYEVVRELLSQESGVIATGGGTVLCDKTVRLMSETGFVVFVQRDVKQILDDLDLEIRPLLKETIEYIFRLYSERYPLYEEASDLQIDNVGNVNDVVAEIIRSLPLEYH